MDWTRGRTIGRGATAAVSMATSRSGEVFAVKSLELSQSEFLQREQFFLSKLNNPFLVSYKGSDITRENNKLMYNLLMEYVHGGTLFDAIRDQGGRFNDPMIGYYTRQILQGIDYLHSSGIVHCDIKGSNILIGETGAKIADFGCAKWANGAAPVGGTPMYMAPEVARGDEQGFPADIWALGCTIIEMATGGPPWPNVHDPISILYKIAFSGELPEFPEFLSCQTKDFLSKCLRTDPKERWTAKQLFRHPFIEEFNSHTKEFNTSSPTSILDQGIWSSIEETETLGDVINESRLDSPAQRIRRLSSNSRVPNWRMEENWITIRSNEIADGEADANSGSVTAWVGDDRKLESRVSGGGILNFLDNNFSSSYTSSGVLMATTCRRHSVVMGSPNFERRKQTLLINQSQFL